MARPLRPPVCRRSAEPRAAPGSGHFSRSVGEGVAQPQKLGLGLEPARVRGELLDGLRGVVQEQDEVLADADEGVEIGARANPDEAKLASRDAAGLAQFGESIFRSSCQTSLMSFCLGPW